MENSSRKVYDFDRVIERKGTMSVKYDYVPEEGMPGDVLPLWVADMDFRVPDEVVEVLKDTAEHGIFGYSVSDERYSAAVTGWYERHFGWKADPAWMVTTPGVVFAVSCAVRAFTQPGDSILIQQPVYYPFRRMIETNGRRVVNNPLLFSGKRYTIDFSDFEAKIVAEQVKMFILCSPHNPVGRVWSEEELRRLAKICKRHGVIIFSDEIHSDFVWEGNTHHVLAGLDEEIAQFTVTATAPSKTFNLAGLQNSNIFISNPQLRDKFIQARDQTGYSECNIMGMRACMSVYENGDAWLSQLKAYLAENIRFMEQFLREQIPCLNMIRPEGTYLVWVDCRSLNLGSSERKEFMRGKAKLWLDEGEMFGKEGEGFERFNIACPRSILEKALRQLKDAVDTLTL